MTILSTYNDDPPSDDGSETAGNTVSWSKIKEELTDPLKNWIDSPDLDGNELILDADGDTSITADTDDQIDIKIGGSDEFHLSATALYPETDSANDLGKTGQRFNDTFTDKINGGVPCRINTGSYVGDGATSLAITGVGFQPKYVKIWPRATSAGALADYVFETTDTIIDDNASGMAIRYGNTATPTANIVRHATDAIISLDADGFTVDDAGTDQDPNKSGVTYNYMATG